MEQLGSTPEDFTRHGGTDGADAAYNEEAGGRDKAGQFRFMGGYIAGK
jgi:hypothetical protein